MAKVVRVVRGPAVKAVPGSVIVNAEYELELKSELGGHIIKSSLDEGKPFKEGDFLVQLDTGDIDIDIEKLQIDEDMLKKRIAVGSPGPALARWSESRLRRCRAFAQTRPDVRQ